MQPSFMSISLLIFCACPILHTVFEPHTSHTSKKPDTHSLGKGLPDCQRREGHQSRGCLTCSTKAQDCTTRCEGLITFDKALRRHTSAPGGFAAWIPCHVKNPYLGQHYSTPSESNERKPIRSPYSAEKDIRGQLTSLC